MILCSLGRVLRVSANFLFLLLAAFLVIGGVALCNWVDCRIKIFHKVSAIGFKLNPMFNLDRSTVTKIFSAA